MKLNRLFITIIGLITLINPTLFASTTIHDNLRPLVPQIQNKGGSVSDPSTGPVNYEIHTFSLVAQDAGSQPEEEEDLDIFDDGDDQNEGEDGYVPDPLYYFNYAMYGFNDFFYLNILEPVAKGYKVVVPKPVRGGIKNFFHNLLFPVRFVNNILQADIENAGKEVGIFVINTTVGVLGFGQVAQNNFDLHTENEDLGQTFGHYGLGNGFYLVLPILGPSSLRDTLGLVGDSFITPVNYVYPWELQWGMRTLDPINDTSFRIGEYKDLVDSAIDPYEALKDAYIQLRNGKIKQ